MKNEITDLRNHMFAALERLDNDDLTPEQLERELKKAQAISELGKVIVDSAKTEVLYAKITGKVKNAPERFLREPDEEKKKIDRPAASYSNTQFNDQN